MLIDGEQYFPTDFGVDDQLFTDDDPTAPISAGYNIVNLDNTPFNFYKETRPNIVLNEGEGEVNDFSELI